MQQVPCQRKPNPRTLNVGMQQQTPCRRARRPAQLMPQLDSLCVDCHRLEHGERRSHKRAARTAVRYIYEKRFRLQAPGPHPASVPQALSPIFKP